MTVQCSLLKPGDQIVSTDEYSDIMEVVRIDDEFVCLEFVRRGSPWAKSSDKEAEIRAGIAYTLRDWAQLVPASPGSVSEEAQRIIEELSAG